MLREVTARLSPPAPLEATRLHEVPTPDELRAACRGADSGNDWPAVTVPENHQRERPAESGRSVESVIDLAQRSAVERNLAAARLVAAGAVFVVMQVGSDPLHSDAVARVTASYAAYGVVVLAATWRFRLQLTSGAAALHALDFAWATAATTVGGGASSHTFALFLFVLAAAAYRWSLSGSMRTGVLVIAIACVQAIAIRAGYTPGPFELDTFLLFVSYVAVLSVLFGLLSERLHAAGTQAIAVGQVLERVGRASGMSAAVNETLSQLLPLLGAREALLVARDADQDALFVWRARFSADGGVDVSRAEPPPPEHHAFFSRPPAGARAWELRRTADPGRCTEAVLLTASEAQVTQAPTDCCCGWSALAPWTRLTVAVTDAPGCWTGRLLLVDAARPHDVTLRLGLLQTLVERVTPALANVYLMRRLRTRVGAAERARLARELHDGVVQTLAVLDLRLELARRRVAVLDPELAAELDETRDVLRADVMDVREMIERVRPTEVDASQTPGELRDRLERFASMSSIHAYLIWTGNAANLTSRQSQELLRIVQEALVNVRRHSGASRVAVHVAADALDWEVTIEDNGRGFGFTGTLTHSELRDRKAGPRVIRERVEALGGTLEIESSAFGARLSILFPRVRS